MRDLTKQEMYDQLIRQARARLKEARRERRAWEKRCQSESFQINYLKGLALKDGLEP